MFAKKLRGQKTLLLKVSQSILMDEEIDYCKSRDCFLVRAARVQFGKKHAISCNAQYMTLNGIRYEIPGGMGGATFLQSFRRGKATNRLCVWDGFIVVPLVKVEQ